MKKLLMIALVAGFGFTTAQAQEVKLGAKAGVNFAKLTGDDVEDADGRTGFHIGVLAEIPFAEKWAIQPEILYSQQGLQSKEDFFDGEIESKLILDYINIPVMVKYYLTDALSVEGGPQFGFRAKAEQEIEITGSNDDGDGIEGTTDLKDSISGFDAGVGGGLAYQLNNGLFLQARYVIGLTNVNADDDEGAFGDDLTNSNLSFSLGYKF